MNTLSWLLYVAEVIPNVGVAFGLMAFFVGLSIAIACVVGAYKRDVAFNDKDEWQSGYDLQRKALRYVWAVPVLVLLSVLTPSKTTIYMIAASEMGETVVTNPEANEIFDAMKARVKEYLAIEEGKTTK